jgi:hypothetical protein
VRFAVHLFIFAVNLIASRKKDPAAREVAVLETELEELKVRYVLFYFFVDMLTTNRRPTPTPSPIPPSARASLKTGILPTALPHAQPLSAKSLVRLSSSSFPFFLQIQLRKKSALPRTSR